VSLYEVFRGAVLGKVIYCSPAGSKACSVADFSRLEKFLSQCKRYGYCGNDVSSVTQLLKDANVTFFERSTFLKERDRPLNKILIQKIVYLNEIDFINRMLFIGTAISVIMKEILVVVSTILYHRISFRLNNKACLF
jgi:hypothetical protein